MWDVLVRAPLGSNTQRKFVTFIASLLVACFGYAIMASAPVSAAYEAKWSGDDTLSYRGRDLKGPVTATQNDKTTLPIGTIYYTSYDAADARTGEPAVGYVIFFPPSTNLAKATSATYRQGDYDVTTGKFSNLTAPENVEIDAKTWGSDPTLQPSSCDVDGIGWLICPVSSYIAGGMDYLYSLLSYFLEVSPITGGDNSIYQMWNIVKGVANICFIIAFLIIIYAQISGAFVSNYTIKKMLPRLVIAALMVNTSYWICSIAVDLSNILGASVQEVFQNMQQQIGAANSEASELSWETATAYALGGGAGVIGLSGLATATYFGGGAFAFLIIAALIPAMFAVFVAVAVLAARQALITVLIVLSPLAFVAYLLPNTEDMFNRWRKLFMNLLIIFPAFSVIFGASQLTGVLIIQNATIFPVVILGLLVQVAPLFITPFLIKLSSGLFSTIAGLTNDRSKGVFDRAKNWATENQQMHRERARRNSVDPARKGRRPLTSAARMLGANGAEDRKRKTATYKSQGDAFYDRTRKGQKIAMQERFGKDYQHASDGLNDQLFQDRIRGNYLPTFGKGQYNRHVEEEIHKGHIAKLASTAMVDGHNEHSEREFFEIVENARAGSYEAGLRTIGEGRATDKKRAQIAMKAMTDRGEAQYETLAQTDAAVQQVRTRGHLNEKQLDGAQGATKEMLIDMETSGSASVGSGASQVTRDLADGILQVRKDSAVHQARYATKEQQLKDDNASIWSVESERNPEIQNLRIAAEQAKIQAANDEQVFNTRLSNIRAEGAHGIDPDTNAHISHLIDPSNSIAVDNANAIQEAIINTEAYKEAESRAEYMQKKSYTKRLHNERDLRKIAGGIDPSGASKVYARATQEMTDILMKDSAEQGSIYSNEGYEQSELLKAIQREVDRDTLKYDKEHGLKPGDTKIKKEQRYGAMMNIVKKAQHITHTKLADTVANSGIFTKTDANGEEVKDADGNKVYYVLNDPLNPDHETEAGRTEFTDLESDTAATSRDLQQMYAGELQKSGVRLDQISGTDAGMMENGRFVPGTHKYVDAQGNTKIHRYTTQSEYGFYRNMRKGRMSQEKLAGFDIDQTVRYINILKDSSDDPTNPNYISNEHRAVFLKNLAELRENEHVWSKVAPRVKAGLEVMENYIDPAYIDLTDREKRQPLDIFEYEDWYFDTYTIDKSGHS